MLARVVTACGARRAGPNTPVFLRSNWKFEKGMKR